MNKVSSDLIELRVGNKNSAPQDKWELSSVSRLMMLVKMANQVNTERFSGILRSPHHNFRVADFRDRSWFNPNHLTRKNTSNVITKQQLVGMGMEIGLAGDAGNLVQPAEVAE